MKWSELERQKRKELDLSGKKSRLVTFCLIGAGICVLLLCVTFTIFCLKLQTTGGV